MNLPPNSNLSHIKLYDLQVVDQMCRGNQDQVLKMVEVFIDQISQSIKDIETAYSENDFLKIKSLAHKIKPLLTYFGTSKLEKEFLLAEVLISKETRSLELDSKIKNLNLLINEVVSGMKIDFNLTNK
jgi:HPt (histidine-containing phosphotransfer) domain-containing protein